ncbi:hypothetical protein [Sporolactobacillus terrae]|uniref:hypothetical protein n=1 Tax=Sporolactobacillus terrae TaxID=269673 RepID=UPI001CBF41AC|nr:hypothetical protein [Sporolactobacillus terrae]UAK17542.1 hypothetical protein K7399_06345 [Sporolactobacillus terrae]
MALSRWTDNQGNTMDEIINNMLDFRNWYEYENDPITGEQLNVNIDKKFSENRTMELNGHTMTFNYIEYDFEKVRPGEERNEMRSSRIFSLSGFILVYSDGEKTQYITNRSNNTSTLTILRKLNNYKKKLEITANPLSITDDMFTWMIYKVLNSREESFDDESHLTLDRIIGFKGATTDKLAEIKGTGNRVMNLLSTLAFLFENESVSYISTRINYDHETIELAMSLSGSIDIDLDSYVGNYLFDSDYERFSKVILETFLEVIPKIIATYYTEKENNDWSVELKNNFFVEIGTTIQETINEKLQLNNS